MREREKEKKEADVKISESVVYWYYVPGCPKMITVIFTRAVLDLILSDLCFLCIYPCKQVSAILQ